MLDDVGDPLLDDQRQAPGRAGVQARLGGETAGQLETAGNRRGIGRKPGSDPGLGSGAKLSYVSSFTEMEGRMRASVIAGLLIAAALSTMAAAAGGEIGRIKSLSGEAQVVRGKAASPAAVGQALQAGDVIKTGAGARIGITFIDNSRFAVGPNTTIALSQFDFDDTTHKGASLTTVDRGSLAVVSGQIAHENKDAMRVRTPTSLLAARGTRFVVEVTP